ncbi:DUF58 domain-containing protein [Clostridium sp. D2Q-14]|uniref:DUF58 domain-containing protein n=1 Tax=Anaeromonas gelatinilytica TaxID=2683194 RepID=UPI00193B99DC|nr:DUF58 domain-containing protein [Anaeromonas gelatinilytica]MBS4534654.1 DUF58 domain-containing protein [Anaeromonas gelatinilytica]
MMLGSIFILILISIIYIFISRWGELAIKNVKYERYVNKKIVYPNEEILITTIISNNKIIPLPWIEIYTELPEPIKYKDQIVEYKENINTNIYKVITSLFPFQRVIRRNRFYIKKRGYYQINNLQITIGDFLGFAKGVMNVKTSLNIVVYPEIMSIEDLIVEENNPQGDISVRRWIIQDPIQIKGVRKYTLNDSFNIIDWKATAKTGDLYVKEFDFTSEPSLMILLNVQCDEQPWRDVNEEKIEQGINIAAAIMNECLDSKIPVGFSTNSLSYSDNSIYNNLTVISPDINLRQGEYILDALAKVSYMSKIKIENFMKKNIDIYDKYTTLVLITPYLNEKAIKIVNDYTNFGYKFKFILLKNDINISNLDSMIEIYRVNNLNSIVKEKNYA